MGYCLRLQREFPSLAVKFGEREAVLETASHPATSRGLDATQWSFLGKFKSQVGLVVALSTPWLLRAWEHLTWRNLCDGPMGQNLLPFGKIKAMGNVFTGGSSASWENHLNGGLSGTPCLPEGWVIRINPHSFVVSRRGFLGYLGFLVGGFKHGFYFPFHICLICGM